MAAAIPEVVGTSAAAGGESAAAGSRAAAGRARVRASRGSRGPRGRPGPAGRAAPAPVLTGEQKQQKERAKRQKQRKERRQRAARGAVRKAADAPLRNYQGIILAEFVLAELLVAITPIATRKSQPGLSPYIPRDLTKLLSIGLVYFLLQLLAVGGRSAGRFGAWFGFLILLTVGLNEAANVAKVLNVFGGGTQAQQGGTA